MAKVLFSRPTRVKNKNPAPVQITAQQILREARERREAEIRAPKQRFTDSTELSDYRLRRRKEFEDRIRRNGNIQVWVEYAQWEESQRDYASARSVWERALKDDHRNHTLWLKYAEFEMKNNFVNSARNVWDRAVELLPRVDQLWYKYIHMEEMLGNIAEARQIFESWMNWSPDQQAWLSFIKFELRFNEIERARSIFQRFGLCHPKVSAFISKGRAEDLYSKFVAFEKQYGDKEGIDEAIVGKTRLQYEDEVRKNPFNYDSWFDYLRLEKNKDRIREIYERAIANVPPAQEKRYWQRYIYLWIDYALYEEIETGDVERTRNVYRECLKLIPHNKFSFAKIWLLAAEFEIRQLNLAGARRILGNAIGKAPKDKIFNRYIEMELQLGNVDRCRRLYERYLEWSPENCCAWRKFAEFERSLAETERARAIFELAISQPLLDMPELPWKAYIDLEISQGESQRTRALYERLLDRTKHYKVWVSFAKFEASAASEEDQGQEDKVDCARAVFDRAYAYYKDSAPELKEDRATLLEHWLNMETSFGVLGDVTLVQSKLPKKVKKRKSFTREDGSTEYEEYTDDLFPEELETTNLKILEAAHKWKKLRVDDAS